MSSRKAREEQLARLKAARAGGGKRVDQYKDENDEVYDMVSDDEYQRIVKKRLEKDDFIEDDGTEGYADDGREEWGGDRGMDEEERRERRAAKKATKAMAKPKAPPRPRTPPPAAAYRPKIAERDEDDFMKGLLSNLPAHHEPTSAPRLFSSSSPPSRKRKSSPEYFASSDSVAPGSDGSYLGGRSSDLHDNEWSLKSRAPFVSGQRATEKKPKLEETEVRVKTEDPENFGMDMQGSPEWPDSDLPDEEEDTKPVIPQPQDEDEDDMEMVVKPRTSKPGTSAAPPKRKYVNVSAVKTSNLKPLPRHADPDEEAATPAWLSLADSLPAAPTQTASSPPPSSPPPQPRKTKDSDAPATTSIDAFETDGSLRMYWLDYFEQEIKVDGSSVRTLYLFGKVFDRRGGPTGKGKWVSCCLRVDGLERNLFVCPRDRIITSKGDRTDLVPSQDDVYREFNERRRQEGVSKLMSKWVKRNYVFGAEGIPNGESEYLKVIYGFDEPALPTNISGKTFVAVLGTNTSPFEIFVLKRKIMGPCWIEIKDAVVSGKGVSWCKLEVSSSDPKEIRPLTDADKPRETPPLTVMSISARTVVNHKENTREIVCASARVWENANIDNPTPPDQQISSIHTVVRPLGDFPPGFVQKCQTERSKINTVKSEGILLSNFIANIQRHDPDVLIGHDFLNVSLEVLMQRMGKLKTPNWSRVGRFRRKGLPPISNRFGSILNLLAGRLVCDLSSDGAKMMISSTTWSLTEMCGTHLKINREDIDPDDTHTFFDDTVSSPDRLIRFVRHCEIDAFFQMAIAAKVQIMPLTKQLTTLAGNSWNRTLNGGRAERNEYILLHEFHRLKYICPDKFQGKNRAALIKAEVEEGNSAAMSTGGGKAGGKRDKFKGGLVFEPKRGLWDKFVLVMDFNSLYPSIIQEYNIDFTTISVITEEDSDGSEKIPDVPSQEVGQGVLPRIIANLVNRRREVKGLMKGKSVTPLLMAQYDIRQLALKLTANSMYGCLGFEYSRFYARPLATLTTFKGREILTSTKELAESIQLDVVYGDTDSVFVNSNVTDYAEAMKLANIFKKQVNDKYKLLEIDLDGTFQRLLLLQKKKYAAVKVGPDGSSSMEVKGLDMKRREFCKLSKDVSQYVLERILSGEPTEVCIQKVHDYLTSVGERVRENKVDLDDYIINKRLGKNPEDYPDAKSQPQVQVALRIRERGGSAKAGDVVQYIFCLGADGKSAKSGQADRAFHPDEIRKNPELKIDMEYYLALQVLPPIERLCDPIEGTDKARLAECLGLDPERYAVRQPGDVEREYHTLGSQISDKERFAEASNFEIRCQSCDATTVFGGLLNDTAQVINPTGVQCPECSAEMKVPSLSVQLELQIRAHISKYYESVLVCDDPSCATTTRALGVYGRRCMVKDCRGQVHLQYTDAALYTQLLYYLSLFDIQRAKAAVESNVTRKETVTALADTNAPTLNALKAVVEKHLAKNGRGCVEMSSIFSFMANSS